MDPVKTIETPTIETPAQPVPAGQVDPNTVQKPTEDLMTRVAKFQPPVIESTVKPDDSGNFNTQDLESAINGIEDENLRTNMEGLRKSLLRGANDKFQELSDLRKEAISVLNTNSEWTPERVQQLTNDPTFISAAQKLAGTGNDEDSMLTEKEQQSLKVIEQTRNELDMLKFNAEKSRQDSQLSQKYANYNPSDVDKIFNDMNTGKLKATREHLWIVANHEQMIENAYKMGQSETQQVNQEKIEAIGANGVNINRNAEPITKNEGETTQSLFSRIIAKNKELHQK